MSHYARDGDLESACDWQKQAVELTAVFAGRDYQGYNDVVRELDCFRARLHELIMFRAWKGLSEI